MSFTTVWSAAKLLLSVALSSFRFVYCRGCAGPRAGLNCELVARNPFNRLKGPFHQTNLPLCLMRLFLLLVLVLLLLLLPLLLLLLLQLPRYYAPQSTTVLVVVTR
jgi:hypothetical protein